MIIGPDNAHRELPAFGSNWEMWRGALTDDEFDLVTKEIQRQCKKNETVEWANISESEKDRPVKTVCLKAASKSTEDAPKFFVLATWFCLSHEENKWYFIDRIPRFVSSHYVEPLEKMRDFLNIGISQVLQEMLGNFVEVREKYNDLIGCAYGKGKSSEKNGMNLAADLLFMAAIDWSPKFSDIAMECMQMLQNLKVPEGTTDMVAKQCRDAMIVDVRNRIEINLAREAVKKLKTGEERFFSLLRLVETFSLSERAMAFLGRVSRCYLWGFDNECIIMCRSLLEAAVVSEISNDDCIAVMGPRKINGKFVEFTLIERIATAVRLKRLTDEEKDAAYRVQKSGNKAVHEMPKLVPDAITIIQDTLNVVRALQQSGATPD